MTPRARIWQVALVLNAVFPPAGYVYVGAWRTAALFAVAVVLGAVAATELTVAFPPGLYALGVPGVIVLALSLAVASGIHAAWLSEDAPARSGSRVRHAATYLLSNLMLLTALQLFRAWWPHAFYTVSSDAMAPTLLREDIVAVRGARADCGHVRPAPGDVILYRRGEAQDGLFRVVAGPDRSVALAAGRLMLDGRPVERLGVAEQPVEFSRPAIVVRETLPGGRSYLTLDRGPGYGGDDYGPRTTPADGWFLMGDNRDDAMDSRFTGPVPARNLCGVAVRVISSQDRSHVGRRP